MKITTASILLACLIVCSSLHDTEGRRRKKEKQKGVAMRNRRPNKLRMESDGAIEFPSELEYTLDVDGEGSRNITLLLNPYVQMPNENKKKWRKYAFYSEATTGESFACKVQRKKGKEPKCEIAGILEQNGESCFVIPNSNKAACETTDALTDGVLLAYDDNDRIVHNTSVPLKYNTPTNAGRRRRSILPEAGFRAIEIVFVADESFMLPFYNRNPGNDAAAEEEAELYATLLANEMTVYYRSVKEVSGGTLDLVIYPSAFRHPGKGNNFPWSANNIRGSDLLDIGSGLKDFARYSRNDLTGVQFDHVMALTGLDLYVDGTGRGLLGVAYTKHCVPSQKPNGVDAREHWIQSRYDCSPRAWPCTRSWPR